jgi:hypothetical protein
LRIERHVFGSFSGYSTLARSAGLSADEARQLESSAYGFGQTSDRGFLKSLRKQPAWFTRSLRGGRRGLTRVLEGSPDDNDRPTLLMITAVVSQQEWDAELCGDLALLLNDAACWAWEGEQQLGTLERTYDLPCEEIPRKAVPKLLALISELEQKWAARQPILVSIGDYPADEISKLEMLIPAAVRGQFSSGCRSLSPSLAVSVNAMAAESDAPKVTYRPQHGAALSKYAQFLAETSLANGNIPLAEIAGYRAFGQGGGGVSAPVLSPPSPRPVAFEGTSMPAGPGPSKVLVAVMLALSIVLGVAGFTAGRLTAPPAASAAVAEAVPRPSVPAQAPAASPTPAPAPAPSATIPALPAATTPSVTAPAPAVDPSPNPAVQPPPVKSTNLVPAGVTLPGTPQNLDPTPPGATTQPGHKSVAGPGVQNSLDPTPTSAPPAVSPANNHELEKERAEASKWKNTAGETFAAYMKFARDCAEHIFPNGKVEGKTTEFLRQNAFLLAQLAEVSRVAEEYAKRTPDAPDADASQLLKFKDDIKRMGEIANLLSGIHAANESFEKKEHEIGKDQRATPEQLKAMREFMQQLDEKLPKFTALVKDGANKDLTDPADLKHEIDKLTNQVRIKRERLKKLESSK